MEDEIFGTGAEDMTEDGAKITDEDEEMPIIFPNDGLEDDFPDEVSADEVSADEVLKQEPEPEPEPEPEQKPEPEPEPEQKPQPEEKTEEQPGEQPEEQAKKKLWDTIREGLSDFTKRFRREQAVKAEIVESQNQGLEPVSEEKVSEEKQLTPAERIKVDACTAIMMAHLKKYKIPYDSQTVKGIVQTALTGYAVALGSDRPLGDLRDANTTKRLISDVMNRITNDIQNRFGDQPIKVTTTVSFGKDEVRTIAKQMSSVLKIPNDDDHLGNSIRTTLVEDFKIAAPLTVLYKSALENERDAKQEIAERDKKIEELTSERDKAQQTFAKLDDALQSEIGFTYSKLIGSGLANPDLFNSEISNTIRNCQTAHNDLENANAALNEKQSTDLQSKLEVAEEMIEIIEKNLRNENEIGFINQLNSIAVSSEEIPAPENPYSPELKEVFADVEEKEKVPDEQPKADDATELPDPATINATTPVAQDSAPATPLDPTSETPVTEEINLGASEESASATEQPASAAEELTGAADESVSHADSEPGTTPADTDGQNQDGATELPAPIPESFTTPDPNTTLEPEPAPADATPSDPTPEEQRESAQTDVDKPTDVITTDAPASKSNGQNNTPNTMAKDGGSLTVRKGEGQDYTGKGQGEEVTETTRQGKGYRK